MVLHIDPNVAIKEASEETLARIPKKWLEWNEVAEDMQKFYFGEIIDEMMRRMRQKKEDSHDYQSTAVFSTQN